MEGTVILDVYKRQGEHSAEYLHVTRKKDKLEKTLADATKQFSKIQKKQSIA